MPLESRFSEKLRSYMVDRMDKHQTGFVPGCGTSVNIKLLVEKLQASRRENGLCCLFVDFKSAYNTVNRERLYEIVLRNNILTQEECDFLRIIHSRLYFLSQGKKFYFKNGVHQGSPISPALFNIYMEDMIKKLKESTGDQNLWYNKFYMLIKIL